MLGMTLYQMSGGTVLMMQMKSVLHWVRMIWLLPLRNKIKKMNSDSAVWTTSKEWELFDDE